LATWHGWDEKLSEELRDRLDLDLDLDTEIAIAAAVVVRVFPIRENPFGTPATLPSVPAVQEYMLSDGDSDYDQRA
jgi:hypothetical protein